MLQQILTDMFIEPELLAELSEDQKQVLFMKMREEQVRRWKEREARLDKEDEGRPRPKKASVKSISWLKASDGDVWVWVMGEHPGDKPYDQICDEVIAERAALQAQMEAEQLRQKKEAELEKRFSMVHLDPDFLLTLRDEDKEKKDRQAALQEQLRITQELKMKEAEARRRAEEEVRRMEEERAQQIYMDLKEVQRCRQQHHDNKHDQQHNHQHDDVPHERAWQESLRKSKVADQRRRSLAKQTREDHRRRSVKALEQQGRVSAISKTFGGTEKPALPPKPKPRNLTLASDALTQKPGVRRTLSSSSYDCIIQWFREEQLPLRAGFLGDHSRIAPWFHGIIPRQEAEDLLGEKGPGYFLVRVSERIFGYVLSYRGHDGFKHFLIDATDSCYMLLGDQLRFPSLADLVEYHQVEPITPSGEELLQHACGQRPGPVDYAQLFS